MAHIFYLFVVFMCVSPQIICVFLFFRALKVKAKGTRYFKYYIYGTS